MLLPGMDGTGQLYSRFINALPSGWRKSAHHYPAEVSVSYDKSLRMVQSIAPEQPFLLVAESYSTPLAIRFAATGPEHLKGLVLCAGFASSPVRGWRRFVTRLLCPVLFRLPLTDRVIEMFLVGENAEPSLVAEVRTAISCVKPAVLAARLVEILGCNVRSDVARIEVPVLYLQAQGDRLVGPNCLNEILQYAKNVAIERIPGPHLLFQREPDRTARIIEEFARWNGFALD
jgi:pimeloyl-ACP methyl ester carboxylesterase